MIFSININGKNDQIIYKAITCKNKYIAWKTPGSLQNVEQNTEAEKNTVDPQETSFFLVPLPL